MTQSGWRGLLVVTFVVALAACDGAEIVVFSGAAAGSAGVSGMSADSGGARDTAGSSGVSGVLASGGALDAGAGGALSAGAGGAGAGADGAGTGGAAGTSGTPCHDSAECPGATCNKQHCGDELGVCKPRNVLCDGAALPVCGCDLVTYWNDCLRNQYGVESATMGECGASAPPCHGNGDCTSSASCSLPPLNSCGAPPGLGTCWVTPDECPSADQAHLQICPPPGSGSNAPKPCVTTCQAVQSGHPYTRLPHGTACP